MGATSRPPVTTDDGLPQEVAVDENLWGSGTAAERPASGDAAGDLYLLIDGSTRKWQRWSGSAWQDISGGTIEGSTGGTDNAVIRADGTGGSTVQSSSVLIDDSDNLSGVVNLTMSGYLRGRDIYELSPTALSAQANDYDPTDFGLADLVRQDLTGDQTITGFAAPAGSDNNSFVITNIDGASDDLTLANESGSSTAANRILTHTGSNVTLGPGESAFLYYDDTSSRWRIVSTAQAAGAGSGDVTGPASSTDNAIARFDGTGGKTIQNSGVTIDDNDNIDGANTFTYDALYDNGNSGSTATIDWNNGPIQKITLTANCTLSFTDPTGPCSVALIIIQDGTGGRSITWPSAAKFPNGFSPTLASGANDKCMYQAVHDDTDYFGDVNGGLGGYS